MNTKITYQPFNRQFANSLDSRYKFETMSDLEVYLNEEKSTAYNGQMVYVEENETLYILNITTTKEENSDEEVLDVKLREIVLKDQLDRHLTESETLKNNLDNIRNETNAAFDIVTRDLMSSLEALSERYNELEKQFDALKERFDEKFPEEKEVINDALVEDNPENQEQTFEEPETPEQVEE